MNILVTGGAGYIGSHLTYSLLERGERVAIIDNLSTGNRAAISPNAVFYLGDIGDCSLVRDVIFNESIDEVIHLAGSTVVPESLVNPLSYYENNTSAARNLIETCVRESVRRFVFSSTAAIYGGGGETFVTEKSPTYPSNPYGRSKLMTEWMLADASNAYPQFNYTTLRYFNVAGADLKGRVGQSTPNATHLIKCACQVALGKRPYLEIYGTDYPTPDGTGIRDYIHVMDLASAHISVLDAMRSGASSNCFNCGYGHGVSVLEVIRAVEAATGQSLPIKFKDRRPGDVSSLIADSKRLKSLLKWQPVHDDLSIIVNSALRWEGTLDE